MNDPIPTPDIEDFDSDPLSQRNEDIFARRELLRVGHVPESGRIVGRDEEISAVEDLLRPAAFGEPPKNAIIYGKTGTGKSLVSKHVTGRARAIATRNNAKFGAAYVDCDQCDTQTRVARSLAQQVQQQSSKNISVPDIGIGASEYFKYLWSMLDELDVFIAIVDEIDKLGDDEVLFKLSRAEESGKTSCYVGVLAISNKIEYYERLNERVKSSLQEAELVFHPYDANQLISILENRRDAFKPDVLQSGVIPRVAALAAREHGDARKAIEILYSAGELAAKNGDAQVTEEHVDAAQDYADVSRFQELIRGSTPHSKYALFALAYLTKIRIGDAFSTGEIYRVYEQVCDSEGTDALSRQRVLELLKEWAFSDITENKYTGGGKGQGSYREHTLLREADMVIETVFEQASTKRDILAELQE
ncbi:Cdc6/Cdc18 family protein [Haloferax profundi]|uniref:ORC1-type DNA replication protein n=1 Tax=Haloferax profundi TaxID=1544718 RepID=A0A0W1RQS6_9EURY|nr:orc1/cdc6 family replication initiation protein [Haloferax profundi]KTG15856.1 cell division control protein Cdc6 [Haloferax profundi]